MILGVNCSLNKKNMNKKNQTNQTNQTNQSNQTNHKSRTWPLLIVSVLLIVLSTLIDTDQSALLGIVKTALLGVGMVGCCMVLWNFIKGALG
jgi:hypothetical protein